METQWHSGADNIGQQCVTVAQTGLRAKLRNSLRTNAVWIGLPTGIGMA